ncbi:MAG TPA: tRNA (cytidine(56)-2'-O)-methyltransferase [Nitrososphaeraceae archaeon]|nr:tRNA (cytidine(56)-2'-O)-methyltransferase [Nitrososphaeraceae archaeon]
MKVSVLRIGHRLLRDDRITTHAALVSRAFGSDRIYMTEVDNSIKETLEGVVQRWGGGSDFVIDIIKNWREMIKKWKKDGGKTVLLTMYGINVEDTIDLLRKEDKILVIIGAEKVPRDLYNLVDYNVAIGNQPHSEIAALAIFLDRAFGGKQLKKEFHGARLKIIPMTKGKMVKEIDNKTHDLP